ncbi:MAG: hypothetical protein IPL56_19905 [Saprospiraceae bacterium]|nr:hypothetical protein [Saprospiraceae bacterium]
MLKKIKSIFVVEDSSAPKASSTSSGNTKGDTNPPMSEIDLTIPAPNNIPESSSENRFLSILAQAIEKNNQQGFDYFEFRQSLINLSKLNMDEMTKYKSAYAAAQAMGVSPATLVDSAKFYLGLLNDEGKKFSIAEQNQRTKVVEDRKNELTQIASEIQKKQEMIIQLQSEVEKLNKILEDKKQDAANMAGKLEHTKNEFETAMKSIAGKISDDIEKMNQYLK